jgi:methylenetetrahydrofolate reductase (NADPH)
MLTRLLARQFKPTRLLDGLAQVVSEPDTGVAGFHLYTFNEIGATERWRQRTLTRLTQSKCARSRTKRADRWGTTG